MSVDLDKLKNDCMWLASMFPAFFARFDELGQEDPRCGDRFEEMHETTKYISLAISELYTLKDGQVLHPMLHKLEAKIIDLIELPRNATFEEVNAAVTTMGALTEYMVMLRKAD